MKIYRYIEILNRSPSWLFVCTCSLLQIGLLRKGLEEVAHSSRIVKIGTLTWVSDLESKKWYNPTIGLIFLWKGNYADCTNNLRNGSFQNASLSFLCQHDISQLYRGADYEIVEETELPSLFCQQLLLRHTVPGDTVLDLCAGSGAFTCQALCSGRNVIAVEDNKARYNAICNRARAVAIGTVSDATMQEEIDNQSKMDQISSAVLGFDNSDEIEELENQHATCAHCSGKVNLKSQLARCQACGRHLHKSCSKTEGDGAGVFRRCPESCGPVSSIFSFLVFTFINFLVSVVLFGWCFQIPTLTLVAADLGVRRRTCPYKIKVRRRTFVWGNTVRQRTLHSLLGLFAGSHFETGWKRLVCAPVRVGSPLSSLL